MRIQWQIYKELELIADSIPEPQTDKLAFVARLSQIWRSRASRFTQKLCYEQKVEHLEMCLALNHFEFDGSSKPSIWLTLWAFLSQPVFSFSLSTSEPEIRQVSDQEGRTW